jgi:cobalt transporter subunit CbtA
MDAFKRLMGGALVAGAIAGIALFLLQWAVMLPLIHEAERYEHAARAAHAADTAHTAHTAHVDAGARGIEAEHEAEHEAAWEPSEGFERTAYTALGTTLTGIGYAALFFGVAGLLGLTLSGRHAWWLGLAGFACFALGPALGLPPRPPGAAVPDLQAAQIWWLTTSLATAAGLWLITGRDRSWQRRGVGILCLLAPHLLGAPHPHHTDALPRDLIRQFALASVGTQAVFWLVLAKAGSLVQGRQSPRP